MCLAVPGRVEERWVADAGLLMARVRFGAVTQDVCLALVDASVGEYVIVHSGFAIQRMDEAAATAALALLDEGGRR
jgi:hydrogenase expression/formation protein HypC